MLARFARTSPGFRRKRQFILVKRATCILCSHGDEHRIRAYCRRVKSELEDHRELNASTYTVLAFQTRHSEQREESHSRSDGHAK